MWKALKFTSFGGSFVQFRVVLAKLSELVDMAWGERIEPPRFDLNAEALDSLDVDERPLPIVKVAYVQHHAQLLATFFMDNPIGFTLANIMKL